MDIKNYTKDKDCPLNKKDMHVLKDGRRIQEKIIRTELEDGSSEEVVELFEEVVPMKVTKRVTTKMVSVPVEQKTECIDDDGNVTTSVKTADSDAMNLGHEKESIETLADEIQALRLAMSPAKKGFFWNKAAKMYSGKSKKCCKAAMVVEEEDVDVQTGSGMEVTLTLVAWTICAVLAGLLTYHLV